MYDRAKMITKAGAFMKYYDASKPIYLEMDTSGIGLWTGLLQVKEGMNCGHNEVPDSGPMLICICQ